MSEVIREHRPVVMDRNRGKEKALVMATLLIDECFQFHGLKRSDGQRLQWPRRECPDPDGGIASKSGNFGTPMSGVITVLPRRG